MNTMMMVGLTGRSGSGKSSVAQHYAELGYPVADGDWIAKQVTQVGTPCLAEIVNHFGQDILLPDGSLDRAQLGRLVFADSGENQWLMALTHRYIYEEVENSKRNAEKKGKKLFFLDGAMIVGSRFEKDCQKLIVVTAPYRLSISRIILRDGISKEAAKARLTSQPTEKQLLEKADFVIQNHTTQEALVQQADKVLHELLLMQQGMVDD